MTGAVASKPRLAEFLRRDACISCRSTKLKTVAQGSYDDEPLHTYLATDPWGVSPMPALVGARWELVGCTQCGTRFHALILAPEWRLRCLTEWMSRDSIEAFETMFAAGSDLQFRGAAHWIGHVHSLFSMTGARPLRVLDFGCGSGAFLAQAALHGAEGYGVDVSAARREIAGNVVTIVPSLNALPPELKGTLDAVTLFEVLEHLDDPRAVLEALRGWIKPGGILVLETPDAGDIDSMDTIDRYRAIHPLDHINAFSKATLTDIAQRSGFAHVDRQWAYVTHSPVQTAKREARRLLMKLGRGSTQQYFRAV